jgi:glycosyltransferase involved in cell wall biosynthesis
MSRGNLLLSASRMESYGMALGEARALGLPIIALRGGNTAALVLAGAGGELLENDVELGRACVRLCRDGAEHARRLALAHAERLAERSWSQAARELLLQLSAAAAGAAYE